MTWFLKNKIIKQKNRIEQIQKDFIKAVNKYNFLVEEYQQKNSFDFLGIQQQPPAEQPPEVPKPAQEGEVKKIITKKNKNDLPDVVEM